MKKTVSSISIILIILLSILSINPVNASENFRSNHTDNVCGLDLSDNFDN